ncbi:hypothetical protein [Eudoraea sp.]|uniref:hypothetical protein n=1 Tax=Eudoraea sp. TaxID=1979955 RepID=UPI003C72B55D
MEKTNLKGRILMELESLISRSCAKSKMTKNFQNLHKAIVKNHYNATDVSIDYHRKRIAMDIVMNEKDYDPKKINLGLPTLYTNLFFNNLCEFLKSCIDKDNRSLAFYAWLLNSYTKKEEELTLA